MEISVADHVQRAARSNFAAGWEELGASNELEETFALSAMNTLEEAVTQITQFLGMHPCDRSDRIPDGKSAHTLYLAGKVNLFNIESDYIHHHYCFFCMLEFIFMVRVSKIHTHHLW